MPNGCIANQQVPTCFKHLLSCASWWLDYNKAQWRVDTGTLVGLWRNVKTSTNRPDKGNANDWIAWDDDIDLTIDTKNAAGRMLDYSWTKKGQGAVFNIPDADFKKKYPGAPPGCEHVKEIKNTSTASYPNLRMMAHSWSCVHCGEAQSEQWVDIDNENCNVDDAKECPTNEPMCSDRTKVKRKDLWPRRETTLSSKPLFLDGIRVYAPKDPDRFLTLYYGVNWATPMYDHYDTTKKQWVEAAGSVILKENQAREEASRKSQVAVESSKSRSDACPNPGCAAVKGDDTQPLCEGRTDPGTKKACVWSASKKEGEKCGKT